VVIARQEGGAIMSILYMVSGILALALFAYLLVALLKPEKFE
jgi:K+-transporting ATPase KdpF subunit